MGSEASQEISPDYEAPAAGGGDSPLPHSIEAEQSVLGGLMLDNSRFDAVAEYVSAPDFYKDSHRQIFRVMADLSADSKPLDVITLAETLARHGELDRIGGVGYLTEMATHTPSAANITAYAKIVRDHAMIRQLISAAHEINRTSLNPAGLDPEDLLQLAEKRIAEIAEDRPKEGGFVAVNPLLKSAVDRIDELFSSDSDITGLTTGLADMDARTSGWQNGELIVLAARPSMGKTALALNFVETAILKQDKPVLVFSMEMPSQSLVVRMLSSIGRINQTKIRNGKLTEEDWPKLSAAVSKMKDRPLFIDDTPGLSPQDVRARVRRIAREHGNPALVVIDYIQLMHVPGNRDGRTQEVSEISRALKALAKEYNCPVIALSQLNRGVEQRPNKRPMNSDLRECVTGDTRVALADGRWLTVKQLIDQKPELLSVDTNGKIIPAVSSVVWKVGRKSVFKVQLATGRTIRATGDHRLMTNMDWKAVNQIQPGDRVALARKLPEPRRVIDLPKEEIILLGHLIGDGSYLSGQPLRYTTNSEANSEAVTHAAIQGFGVTVNRHQRQSASWHQLVFSGNGNRWQPAGVNRWLRELGIFNQRSHQKRIPEIIFSLSDKNIGLFLKHLWATDGTIYTRPVGAKGSHLIHYSTNSEGLAQDVAALLQRLGIIARIQKTQKQSYRPGYLVCITGAEMQLCFLASIGGFGPRVEQARKLAQRLESVRGNTNVDSLPIEIFAQVKEAMKVKGVSHRKMAALRGTAYGGSAHFTFAPSRATVLGYGELLGNPQLIQYAKSDLFWDRVVNVEEAGEEDVYDLTVPEHSSWLANGIVSHNSGAIEQDADIVLFIYRDEYYNEESPDKGIAELIIGKQRNGEVGTCRAAFIGHYTRFENLAPEYFSSD